MKRGMLQTTFEWSGIAAFAMGLSLIAGLFARAAPPCDGHRASTGTQACDSPVTTCESYQLQSGCESNINGALIVNSFPISCPENERTNCNDVASNCSAKVDCQWDGVADPPTCTPTNTIFSNWSTKNKHVTVACE